jgi:hypothetical protein
MKIPAIKKLVENASMEDLIAAEEEIIENECCTVLAVEGEDEGEQLTHVIAAIYIKDQMDKRGCDFKTALREYTQKVRESIS